jgi:hypothetical protein
MVSAPRHRGQQSMHLLEQPPCHLPPQPPPALIGRQFRSFRANFTAPRPHPTFTVPRIHSALPLGPAKPPHSSWLRQASAILVRLCSIPTLPAVTPPYYGDATSTLLAPAKLLELESPLFEHDAARPRASDDCDALTSPAPLCLASLHLDSALFEHDAAGLTALTTAAR